jgi:hypothetical protein
MIFQPDADLRSAAASRGGAGALRAMVRRRHAVPVLSTRAGSLPEQAMFFTRGSTLHSTLEYLDGVLSPAERDAVLDRLPAEARTLLDNAAVTDDVPYHVALSLWRSADLALRERDAQWAEHAGADAIRGRGMKLYGGLLQKPTPLDFVTQHISLFQRYYRPGDMKITERVAGRAIARLVGFEPGDRLFCRRLTGGWLAAIEIAGGHAAQATHARCVLEGDLFCEWDVRWR